MSRAGGDEHAPAAVRHDESPPRRTARWVVLAFLITGFAWAPIIAASFTRPTSAPFTATFIAGLVAYGAAVLVVLLAAADPASTAAAGLRKSLLPIAACVVLWLPAHAWAESDRHPWAWLAGFAIAACFLASRAGGIVAAVLLGVGAFAGGAAFGGSILAETAITAGCAAAVWAMCQAVVWIHRLWWAAQEGREAQARLAVAEERVRVARELHDVLGHRLAVIALRAETAAGLAAHDPARAAAESERIRELARGTLLEARRAIRGESAPALPAQLASVDRVLGSAGIATTIEAEPATIAELPAACSGLMATALREGVTNLLRHSDARTVTIGISAGPQHATLSLVNDGAGPDAGTGTGTGLASLASRCAAAGAELVAGRSDDDRFELRLRAPLHPAGSPA